MHGTHTTLCRRGLLFFLQQLQHRLPELAELPESDRQHRFKLHDRALQSHDGRYHLAAQRQRSGRY